MLHNIGETTEGPPNQPWRDVNAKVAAKMDASIAPFDSDLSADMASFDELTQ